MPSHYELHWSTSGPSCSVLICDLGVTERLKKKAKREVLRIVKKYETISNKDQLKELYLAQTQEYDHCAPKSEELPWDREHFFYVAPKGRIHPVTVS